MPLTYKDSGVDLKKGNEASRMLYDASRKTWKNRNGKVGEVVSSGTLFFSSRFGRFDGFEIGMNFDTVGTKTEVAEEVGDHSTIAFDLFAMVCDDAVCHFAEPCWVGSNLEVSSIDLKTLSEICEGYVSAAEEAGVAVVNGEIAEIGNRINGKAKMSYNWGACCLWAREPKPAPKNPSPGDKIISIRERGFRSNGISLARKLAEGDKNALKDILFPSQIYCRKLLEIFSLSKRLVHITGGGIPEKLGRCLFPLGLGAVLDNLFPPCKRMAEFSEEVGEREAYSTWNMGNGFMVVCKPEFCERIEEHLNSSDLDSKVCGTVINEKRISIQGQKGKLDFFPS